MQAQQYENQKPSYFPQFQNSNEDDTHIPMDSINKNQVSPSSSTGSPRISKLNDTSKESKNCTSPKIEKPIAIKPGFKLVKKNNSPTIQPHSTPTSYQKLEEQAALQQQQTNNLTSNNNSKFKKNPGYPYAFNQIFEPRSCDALDTQLRMEFPYMPPHIAMLMMSYKMAIEAQQLPQNAYQQQYGLMENNLMQQYYQQQFQFQQQQQQQKYNQTMNLISQSKLDSSEYPCPQEDSRKILHKKIKKQNQQQSQQKLGSAICDRSREQQKKEREETKNILRNTGNAIKNFHKEQECRELILDLLNNDQKLFKQYYSNFLPQKLEKFEDFQEIWHVDGVNEDIYKLKKTFRNVCWTFMESYFFQYFFHKSRCQKESLRALVKFRHRFMEGIIDPECFHYFKKIGQK